MVLSIQCGAERTNTNNATAAPPIKAMTIDVSDKQASDQPSRNPRMNPRILLFIVQASFHEPSAHLRPMFSFESAVDVW